MFFRDGRLSADTESSSFASLLSVVHNGSVGPVLLLQLVHSHVRTHAQLYEYKWIETAAAPNETVAQFSVVYTTEIRREFL